MDYQKYLLDQAFTNLQAIQNNKECFNNFIDQFEQHSKAISEYRKQQDEKIQKMLEDKKKRRWNFENRTIRKCRLLYLNDTKYPSYVCKYFQKFIEGSLEEYERMKQQRIDQLVELFNTNELSEDDLKKTVEQEFPETPQNNSLGFFLLAPTCLAFTLSHNCYYNPLKPEQHLELGCFVFDNEMKRERFDRKAKKREELEYVEGLRDVKMVIREDEAILIKGEKVIENIAGLLFYIKFPDLATIKSQLQDVQNVRYSLQDFEYNVEIDSEYLFPGYYKILEELELPNQDNADELPERMDGYLFCYYVSCQSISEQSQKPRLFIEALRQIKFINERDSNSFFSSFNEFIETGINKDQTEFAISPGSLLIKRDESQSSNSAKKPQKIEENASNEDEPLPEPILEFPDTCFPLITLAETQTIEQMQQSMADTMKNSDNELFESFKWGYEFSIREASWERTTQIRRIARVGDFVVKKKPEPEREEEEEADAEAEEEENEENDEAY